MLLCCLIINYTRQMTAATGLPDKIQGEYGNKNNAKNKSVDSGGPGTHPEQRCQNAVCRKCQELLSDFKLDTPDYCGVLNDTIRIANRVETFCWNECEEGSTQITFKTSPTTIDELWTCCKEKTTGEAPPETTTTKSVSSAGTRTTTPTSTLSSRSTTTPETTSSSRSTMSNLEQKSIRDDCVSTGGTVGVFFAGFVIGGIVIFIIMLIVKRSRNQECLCFRGHKENKQDTPEIRSGHGHGTQAHHYDGRNSKLYAEIGESTDHSAFPTKKNETGNSDPNYSDLIRGSSDGTETYNYMDLNTGVGNHTARVLVRHQEPLPAIPDLNKKTGVFPSNESQTNVDQNHDYFVLEKSDGKSLPEQSENNPSNHDYFVLEKDGNNGDNSDNDKNHEYFVLEKGNGA